MFHPQARTTMTCTIIFIILLASLICEGEAFAAQHWLIDFENDDGLWQTPPASDVGGAKIELIGAEGGALAGKRSLQGDSIGLDNEWHEILHTSPKVALKPGARYCVRMEAQVADIDMGERGERPAFYFMLRSRSRGPNDPVDVYGPFWLREKGARTQVAAILDTRPGVDDYYLNVGIRKQGKLIIDDIAIAQITGPSPARGKPIRPLYPDNHPAWRTIKANREIDDLPRKLDEMTVVGIFEMCNGTMPEVTAFMRDYVKPDALDWASAVHPAQWEVAKVNGSWYTTSSMEYQEHYKVEEPELWDRRWELVLPSMTRTLSGQINYWETFGEGGYFMCHNGSFWNDYYRSRTLKLVDKAQGICQDNIGVPPFTTAGGCFGAGCESRFREHLARLYSPAELGGLGIDDLRSFSFRDYALDNGLTGDRALDDAIAREYIRFQYLTHRDRWLEHAAAFKENANAEGRAISTSGNQISMTGPFSIVLSPINDILEVERLEYLPDYRPPNISAAYKIGRAAGYDQRPVWFRGTNHIGPDHDLNTSSVCLEAQYGEAAANGCIRTIHMADDHWPSLTVTKAFVRIPEIREMTTNWADLLRENRAIYSGRESMARVAVVYSLPTMIWADFYALGIHDWTRWSEFERASRALDAAHVPHDALILGYPGLWDGTWSLERMKRYDALVIPSANCVSDAQLAALADYAEGGGELYLGGGFGEYNENHEPRTPDSTETLLPVSDAFEVDRDVKRIARLFGLKTSAPSTLLINPWLSADGHALALHVVNYDLHAGTNTLNIPGEVEIEVPLPHNRKTPYDSEYLLTSGGARLPPQVQYDLERGTAMVRFDLRRPYGVIVLADREELRAKEIEIRSRRMRVQSELRAYAAEHLR